MSLEKRKQNRKILCCNKVVLFLKRYCGHDLVYYLRQKKNFSGHNNKEK